MAAAITTPSETPSRTFDATTKHEAWASAKEYLDSRIKNQGNAPSKPFEIPVIDLGPSFSPSLADRQKVASQIRSACVDSGFFYITNHGIPESASDGILKQAERFLRTLPREKKQALHVEKSAYYHGWEPPESTSINGDAETKEGFNWGYEEGLDPTGGDGEYRQLDGTKGNGNQWPNEEDLPGFYDGVKEYYGHVLTLARHLFRLFALSLELPEDHFDPMTTHPGGIGRLLYYPPSKNPKPFDPETDGQEIGLGAHSDYECFTILLCSSSPGLEVLSPDNRWTSAPRVDGGLIVNVADFLMRWTNGVYKSTVHRVVNRTDKPRYSVPFFFSINYEQQVETLPSCISEDNPSKFPPIKAGEYILQRLATTRTGGKGY